MTTQCTTTNRTLERRDSFSAWLSGFEAYQRGVYGDLVQYGSPHWRDGYYDAQAAAELVEYQEDIEDRAFWAGGTW